jgi:hypothetical protein
MSESNQRVIRIALAAGQLGVKPSKLCERAGLNYTNFREIMGSRAEPRDGTVAVLRDTLRDIATERFQALAEIAIVDRPDVEILRALTPVAVQLAATLQQFLAEHDAAGWPRRLTPQEQAERMAGHDAELARIEAEEEEARRSIENVKWGEPTVPAPKPASKKTTAAKPAKKKTSRK